MIAATTQTTIATILPVDIPELLVPLLPAAETVPVGEEDGVEVKEDVEVEVDVVETVDELVAELLVLVVSAANPPSVETTPPRPSNTIPMLSAQHCASLSQR